MLCGTTGLIFSAQGFYQAPFWSFETFVYPITLFLSALLLGTVTVGMLLGHWYLIDTGQSLDPFIRIYKFFVVALVVQTIFLLISVIVLYNFGVLESVIALERLWTDHRTLFLTRVISGQVAPLILSWMIWRTLVIPHTMAATGLFLHRPIRRLRWRNFRKADLGADLATVLTVATSQPIEDTS